MENIKIVEIDSFGIITEHVIIDRGNGEYTSMTKEHWDQLQGDREQSESL